MTRPRSVGALGALALIGAALAQPSGTGPLEPPANGPRRADPTWHALVGGTVHVSPTQTLEKATVVIRDGRIVSVGADAPPAGARVWDCAGLHVYAAFIDPFVEVDAPRPDAGAPGVHWNARVTPQRSALDGPGVDRETAESLRKLGFAAAGISPRGGVFRGTGAVVSLAQPASDSSAARPPVYLERAYQTVALETGSRGRGAAQGPTPDISLWPSYPDSQMGAIALVRQTFIDADWQRAARAAGAAIPPNSLDAVPAPDGGAPILFNTDDELEVFRAIKIADEFNRTLVVLGCGTEFRRLAGIEHGGGTKGRPAFVLPLAFPKAPDVSGIGKADAVELRDLMTWEQAPTNPRRLDAAGITVALTTGKGAGRRPDRSQFADNLRKAIQYGLKPDRALAMVTTNAAEVLGVGGSLGTIEAGKVANITVADGDLFTAPPKPGDKDAEKDAKQPETAQPGDQKSDDKARGKDDKQAKVRDIWIDGVRHEINAAPEKSAVGVWTVSEADGTPVDPGAPATPRIEIDDKNAVTIKEGDKSAKASNVRVRENRVEYTYDGKAFGVDGFITDQATVDGDELIGVSAMPDGTRHQWKAKRTAPAPDKPDGPRAGGPRAPGIAGEYRMAAIDGQPIGADHPDAGLIVIKDDKSVLLKGRGKEIAPAGVAVSDTALAYTVDMAQLGGQGQVSVKGELKGDALEGTMAVADGSTHTWRAVREARDKGEKREPIDPTRDVPQTYGYPFGPYAMERLPAQEHLIITGATIWTSGPAGVIENGALLIADGKIVYVGPSASMPRVTDQYRTVDAAGRHITAGLIDCHSHTGISRGVNESGQAVTAEVRIQDVTDPDSISWYRQLAGGVTSVNNLHGSANAIGGQNCVNKNRWGVEAPDQMHLEGATPGIKFALGENPKQSNWGDTNTTRYPQTRMGVETIIRDRFTAAREYGAAWARWNADQKGVPPRRDLELEAMAQILAGQRLVHCHSYRQDEILMLCRVADDFGFKIGTFQHILEGYKVADEIATHALGASAFSDWWAYKVEVQDAIPQAGPIMAEQGVVVSYNSDSDELARRMNTEAAKAVRYGDMKPEEALKFVTINPAIQLAIADRVGSLEAGKDADFAIWSGPPLSAFTRCEATYVDGREYFSLAQDKAHRERIAAERRRLIQKILALGEGGDGGSGGGGGRGRPGEEEEDVGMIERFRRAAEREHNLGLLRRGLDPRFHVCGECGMSLEAR